MNTRELFEAFLKAYYNNEDLFIPRKNKEPLRVPHQILVNVFDLHGEAVENILKIEHNPYNLDYGVFGADPLDEDISEQVEKHFGDKEFKKDDNSSS